MINKRYLKILILVLITNLLIFVVNSPVFSSENHSSVCPSLERCVLLGNQPLFEIKEKAGDFTPEVRAFIISKKIKSKANDMSINIDSFSAINLENSTMAAVAISNSIDKEYLFTITQNDATAAGIGSPLELASQYNNIIQKAINNYRNNIRGNSWYTLGLLVGSFICLIHQILWSDSGLIYFAKFLINCLKTIWHNLKSFYSKIIKPIVSLKELKFIANLKECLFVKPQSSKSSDSNSNQNKDSSGQRLKYDDIKNDTGKRKFLNMLDLEV